MLPVTITSTKGLSAAGLLLVASLISPAAAFPVPDALDRVDGRGVEGVIGDGVSSCFSFLFGVFCVVFLEES